MLRRAVLAGIILLMALGVFSGLGNAHVPSGSSLKVTTYVGDYVLKVIIYPGRPEVNKTSEIVVGLINTRTNAPYLGPVMINGVSAKEFSPGFYETSFIFNEVGNNSIAVEFQGKEPLSATLTVEVREASGPGIFLAAVVATVSIVLLYVGYLIKKKRDTP